MASFNAVLSIPNDSSQIIKARRFTEERLKAWGVDFASDVVVLCVSELVTNALLHVGSGIELRLSMRGSLVRVEVHDGSPVQPSIKDHSVTASTGRGLVIVESLSTRWGSKLDDSGKVVWFEVDTSGKSEIAPVSVAQ